MKQLQLNKTARAENLQWCTGAGVWEWTAAGVLNEFPK